MRTDIYSLLKVRYDADETAIKRAYAALIKQYRPDSHPAEFAQIREAYEQAMRQCKERQRWEEWEDDDDSQQPEEAQLADPPVNAAQPSALPESPEQPTAEPVADSHTTPPQREEAQEERRQPEEPVPPHRQASEAQAPEVWAEQIIAEPVVSLHANSVAAMMGEFENGAGPDSEEDMLLRYRAHTAALAAMPLDQQMDYEQELCHWLLFTANSPLLVFREANKRYRWVENSAEIARTYGSQAGRRITAMHRLAEMYAAVREARNPYLMLDGKNGLPAPYVAGHYSALQAKQQGALWQSECASADWPSIARRVIYGPRRIFQVFWVDVAIGLFAAWLEWPDAGPGPNVQGALMACLIGVIIMLMPPAARGVSSLAEPRVRDVISRYRNWRERIFSEAPPQKKLMVVLGAISAVLGGITAVAWLVSIYPLSIVFIIGPPVWFAAAWYVYAALARLEAFVTGIGIKLGRFPAWLRALPDASKREGGLREAFGWDRAKKRLRRARTARTIPWWMWIVIIQIMLAIARAVKQ